MFVASTDTTSRFLEEREDEVFAASLRSAWARLRSMSASVVVVRFKFRVNGSEACDDVRETSGMECMLGAHDRRDKSTKE